MYYVGLDWSISHIPGFAGIFFFLSFAAFEIFGQNGQKRELREEEWKIPFYGNGRITVHGNFPMTASALCKYVSTSTKVQESSQIGAIPV